jgi:hypothetical protein
MHYYVDAEERRSNHAVRIAEHFCSYKEQLMQGKPKPPSRIQWSSRRYGTQCTTTSIASFSKWRAASK